MRHAITFIIISLFLLFILAPSIHAQSGYTQVTATITDAAGHLYQNAPFTVSFFDPGTSGILPTLNNSPFQRVFQGYSTDGFGVLRVTLPDNNVIAASSGATGTEWTFNICSYYAASPSGVLCFQTTTVVTGSTEDLSSTLHPAPPLPGSNSCTVGGSTGLPLPGSTSGIVCLTSVAIAGSSNAIFPNNIGPVGELNYTQKWGVANDISFAALQSYYPNDLALAGQTSGVLFLNSLSNTPSLTTAYFEDNTGTVAELNYPQQSWTSQQFCGGGSNGCYWTVDTPIYITVTTSGGSKTGQQELVPETCTGNDPGNGGLLNLCKNWLNLAVWENNANTSTLQLGKDTNDNLTWLGSSTTATKGVIMTLVGTLTTTSATSDALTITGLTGSSHCVFSSTNATAATNIASSYISDVGTNSVTLTHAATSGMTYNISCTSY